MAKILSFVFLLTFSTSIYSDVVSEYSSSTAKYKIAIISNKSFSIDCVANSKCSALQALTGKITEKENTGKQFGNPASHFCSDAKGANIILTNDKNQEYDFCKFTDNSLIDSWDLYYSHHKKETVN